MQIFISGGCKNGKSTYAQRLAKENSAPLLPLYYIATMTACDIEDEMRIIRHKKEREGFNFITIEQPYNIEEILTKCNLKGTFLLDSLTALLANEMFLQDGTYNEDASQKIAKALSKILANIKNIIFVSDYIYSDAFVFDPLTESYRKSLAILDSLVATQCQLVQEVQYTQIITHKGRAKGYGNGAITPLGLF